MSRDQDARVLSHTDIHGGDFRIALGFGIGFIKKRHAVYAALAGLQGKSYQVVCSKRIIQSLCQRLLNECVHFLVIL